MQARVARDVVRGRPLLGERHRDAKAGAKVGFQLVELAVDGRPFNTVRAVRSASPGLGRDVRLELLGRLGREYLGQVLGRSKLDDLLELHEAVELSQALGGRPPPHGLLANRHQGLLGCRAGLGLHEGIQYRLMVHPELRVGGLGMGPHRLDRGGSDAQLTGGILEPREEFRQGRFVLGRARVERRDLAGPGVELLHAGLLHVLGDLAATGRQCIALVLGDPSYGEVGAIGYDLEAQASQAVGELDPK